MKTFYKIRQNPHIKGRTTLVKIFSILWIVSFISICPITPAYSQVKATCIWDGDHSTSFGDKFNWSSNKIPASGDDIIFSSSATYDCILDKDRVVGNITNASSRNLNTASYDVTINGSIAFSGSGKIDATNINGAITFAGSSAQTLPAAAFTGGTISNLYSANGSLGGVTLNGDLTVDKRLIITNGRFSISSNTLTLNDSLKVVTGTLSGGTSSNLIVAGSGYNVTIPAITLKDLTLNRPNGLTLGGTMAIHGVVTLTSGTFTLGANTLNYYGTTPVITSGIIEAINPLSKVTFLNSSPITFPVGLFRFYIYSLSMNGTGGVTLTEDLTINKNLELISGKIHTNSYSLNFGNTTNNITGGNSNSYIDGNCKKTGNTAFTFHIGNPDVYAPIAISAANGGGSATDAFTAKYFGENPHPLYDSTLHENSIARVSSMEYWTLDRTGGTNNVSVTLSWDDRSGGVSNLNDLTVAHWDGAMWADQGNAGTTGDNTSGTITSKLASNFSPFTLASKSGSSNMLPIILIDFSVKCMDHIPQINWSTASEINNSHFEIETSEDAVNWKAIKIIPGAGNSTVVKNYKYTYEFTKSSKCFYRLKSVDFDGQYYFSKLLFLENCESADVEFKLFPVPSKGVVFLDFSGDNKRIGKLVICNLMGEIIYSYDGFIDEINLSDQAEGTYYVIAYYDDKRIIEKFSIIK